MAGLILVIIGMFFVGVIGYHLPQKETLFLFLGTGLSPIGGWLVGLGF